MIDQARSALRLARKYREQGDSQLFRFWLEQAQITRRLTQYFTRTADPKAEWQPAFEWRPGKGIRREIGKALKNSTDDEGAYMDRLDAYPQRPILPGRREPAREETVTG